MTAPYHPQTNGLDEKANHNIKRALTKLVNEKQDNWNIDLKATLFSLRSKVQTTTKSSRFALMYGREAVFPSEVPVDMPLSHIVLPEESRYVSFLEEKKSAMEIVKATTTENISKSQDKQQKVYEKKVQKKCRTFFYTVGQEVLLFNMRKKGRKGGTIEPDFYGPYVIQAISGQLATLSNKGGATLKNKYNMDHLKPYRRTKTEDNPVTFQERDENQSMETPQGNSSSTSTSQQRPSVICYAAGIHQQKIVTIEFKCYGLRKMTSHWKWL